MFLLFGVDNIRQEKMATTIIVGDHSVWTYKDKKWMNLRSRSSFSQLSWTNFQVFQDNERMGEYYLWYQDKWYVFDAKKNAIPITGNLIAYQSNYDLNIRSFKQEEVQDFQSVYTVLENNNLGISSEFTSIYKVPFDIDGDSLEEEFYIISNAFPMDFDPDQIFSIAYMVKDDVIYPIYTDISKNTSFNGCKPFYQSFLDVNQDGIYELILSCAHYSVSDQVDMLYQFDQGAFKIIISNQ